ncbi:ATP-grasp domain-containing protein [Marinitenerispora sediminis]|uniref:ATP-grasp domain-containing protein n=1 Tax=Marinitenerispora sediminis TaxID=1931232 RepID=A0A368TBM8_9ACTN|nr:hypothetical protein [Marinitenerispora sediminis]RCV57963.1 hypothetical protein DEF28_00675 [Marinitenerispora sediminis]RCV62304.1 hypothetical protein DEF23_00095 [Marinitenerispora sediminis]RCV62564.1 hypothetical protein DEF24_00400 [Marinitenerispora sediminis]
MGALALVTDADSLPIDYDMPLLLDACRAVGLTAEVCDWDDPSVDWGRFGTVLLRSPWTYVERLPEFLAWGERVAASTQLFNPMPVVRWSLDKLYLADLAAYGVPVVPSRIVGPGTDPLTAVREFRTAHPQAAEIVVKPTVGAYSKDVQRYGRHRDAEAAGHIARLLGRGDRVILQPYLESIDRDGETDMIYFDGVYSHAIRKSALLLPDGTVSAPTQDVRKARDADEGERAVAQAVFDAAASHLGLDRPLLYGRVDLVRADDGTPVVLEMELCEPSLSLPFAEGGALRFARALAGRLDR